jgi:hypothetical protein
VWRGAVVRGQVAGSHTPLAFMEPAKPTSTSFRSAMVDVTRTQMRNRYGGPIPRSRRRTCVPVQHGGAPAVGADGQHGVGKCKDVCIRTR